MLYRLLLRMIRFLLPERLLSRLVGHLARVRWPGFLLRMMLRRYIAHFQVDLDEAQRPLGDYQTFTDFFTRSLKQGARTIDEAEHSIISPVDGKVYSCGPIDDQTIVQVKGAPYTIQEMLAGSANSDHFRGGSYLTIYLSPRDYHRIHAPIDGVVRCFQYTPGRLLPVNQPSVEMFPRLFVENERLVSFVESYRAGCVAVIKVGATCVGRIRLSYTDYVSNRWGTPRQETHTLLSPATVSKGGEIGMFEMGSTVILLFEPHIKLDYIAPGDILRMGQRIASISPRAS